MPDREKVIKGLRDIDGFIAGRIRFEQAKNFMRTIDEAVVLLKEQDELLKHEYLRGYNNGRADERGLQEGTIMQTFSPD